MAEVNIQVVPPDSPQTFHLIANWYRSEWNIPHEKTIQRLQHVTTDKSQLQVLLTVDNLPISTGGLYTYVGLLDVVPEYNIYKSWLALVYTVSAQRKKGYGELICKFIQDHARKLCLDTMHLYTDTAEPLYKRLGWKEVERRSMGSRNIVVMKLDLSRSESQSN